MKQINKYKRNQVTYIVLKQLNYGYFHMLNAKAFSIPTFYIGIGSMVNNLLNKSQHIHMKFN
jgi:hypothetical protein